MAGVSVDTHLERVFGESAIFNSDFGEVMLNEPGPEGLYVLLDGILNGLSNSESAEQKISVETLRVACEKENWSESKSLTLMIDK